MTDLSAERIEEIRADAFGMILSQKDEDCFAALCDLALEGLRSREVTSQLKPLLIYPHVDREGHIQWLEHSAGERDERLADLPLAMRQQAIEDGLSLEELRQLSAAHAASLEKAQQ